MRTERGVEHPLHRGRVDGVVCPIDSFRRRSPGQRRRLRQRAGRRRGSCGSPLRSRPRHLGTARPTADHRRALPRQRRLARPAVPGAVGQLCPAPAVDRLFRRVGGQRVSCLGRYAVCGGVDGFGGARLVRGVGTRRVRSRRPLSISRLPTASAQTTGSRRNISRSGRVGPANNSARHPRRGPARACVRPRRPAPAPRVPRSRAGSYRWPVREPRRTGGRGVRPLPPPDACRCQGAAVRPYAVVRRTRRRGDAVRGAAGPAGWGRWRAGTACACCAR